MAKYGWDVTVVEKHTSSGGRARQLKEAGFTFDMGPSWYWMPDVFEKFFHCFGKKVSDYYHLTRLDPSYRIYWPDSTMNIPAGYEKLRQLFEQYEPGSANKLDQFLSEASYKYEVGINKLVYKPGQSITEFADMDLIKGLFKLDVFTSVQKHVHKLFRHPQLRQLLEFPVLFLGALSQDTPALYSLMNYADIKLGTWYPQGGMYCIVDAMHSLAKELGVHFHFNCNVKKIEVKNGNAKNLTAIKDGADINIEADAIIGSADYHFIESALLDDKYQSYTEAYWDKRAMAPSCLLYFVGINKKLNDIFAITDNQGQGENAGIF